MSGCDITKVHRGVHCAGVLRHRRAEESEVFASPERACLFKGPEHALADLVRAASITVGGRSSLLGLSGMSSWAFEATRKP